MRMPSLPVANTGSPLADFELGLPAGTRCSSAIRSITSGLALSSAYFTDDWKIKPRFTLTYGVRYELLLPATELFGHLADLDVNPANFMQIPTGNAAANVGPFSGTLPASLIRPNYKKFRAARFYCVARAREILRRE